MSKSNQTSRIFRTRALVVLVLPLVGCGAPEATRTVDAEPPSIEEFTGSRRMPAEWELQASTWLQWPQAYEGDGIEDVFVSIVEVVTMYQPMDLVAADAATLESGEMALAHLSDDNIRWHVIPNDSSWMRDNGPRYVEVDGTLVVQNWEFDAWGGGFGAVPFAGDNSLPNTVAGLLELALEQVGLVHERGDLEVNGTDTAIVSWSVLSQRNPGLSRDEITEVISATLGVTSVVYTEGFEPADGTRGHVDGAVRFVTEDTVVVGDNGSRLFDAYAEQIAAQRPDLILERMPIGRWAPTMNWLVGNGFVLTGTSNDAAADAVARDQLRRYYPEREVHFIDVDALWENGGGVHCVTNDQPAH